MRGIILAGGMGSRLRPTTKAVNKHLLIVYDKPMIYYPLSTLMLAGIREVLIICNPSDIENFKALLGNGSKLGMDIEFIEQSTPGGISEAFILGESFIGNGSTALILGDNLFIGEGFTKILQNSVLLTDGGKLLGYKVADPSAFGVVEFDINGNVRSIEEKPISPKSNFCVTGLYFFDNNAPSYSKSLKKSKRGELEIIDLCNIYLSLKKLRLDLLGRTFVWRDMGTINDLHESASIVRSVQLNQGYIIACLEEVAYNNGWIDVEKLIESASQNKGTAYGEYILSLARSFT